MTAAAIEMTQRKLARLAGALYLATMAGAIYSQVFIRGALVVPGDAAQTARRILESERLFRAGIVIDIAMLTGVLLLVWALYVLLRPVNRQLALLAGMLRLAELAIHYVATVFSLVGLTLLGGADYLTAFEPAQLQALARVAIGAQGTGINLGFVLLGLGSAIFAWLFYRSRYVPRLLAAWGILASLLLSTYALAVIVDPAASSIGPVSMIPMFIYEVALGGWLLVKGVDIRAAPPGDSA
jgi:hypothetical protein